MFVLRVVVRACRRRALLEQVHFTPNEADYWGTISQIDRAVGRVRGLLRKHNLAQDTWVSITADNGPEVNPAGGQSTGIIISVHSLTQSINHQSQSFFHSGDCLAEKSNNTLN